MIYRSKIYAICRNTFYIITNNRTLAHYRFDSKIMLFIGVISLSRDEMVPVPCKNKRKCQTNELYLFYFIIDHLYISDLILKLCSFLIYCTSPFLVLCVVFFCFVCLCSVSGVPNYADVSGYSMLTTHGTQ
jgi:hypothetical protein